MSSKKNVLIEKMLEALRGNFKPRKDEVEGRYILSGRAAKDESHPTSKKGEKREFADVYVIKNRSGYDKVIAASHIDKWGQKAIEAFVFILEDEGLAKVDRVIFKDTCSYEGMLVPEFTPKAISLIQEVAATFYEECTEIFTKRNLIDSVSTLIGKSNMACFKKEYRQQILNGITSTDLGDNWEAEVLWANVTIMLMREIGFDETDEDFVKVLWEKSKTIPRGHLEGDYGAQVVFAAALIKKDYVGLLKFDYIRDRLPYSDLSKILATIPVRTEDVEMKPWQIDRRYPSVEDCKPIIEFIDSILSK